MPPIKPKPTADSNQSDLRKFRKKVHRNDLHDAASADSVFSDDDGKKPNIFIRFLRKLALPSHEELKKFNWRSVKAQFDLLDNYDECQKDIYMVESNEIDPVDCPYRIDDFLTDIPTHGVGWSVVPSEVHSLYANPIPRGSLGRKKAIDIPVDDLNEEESLQMLEDLFHDIPNEEIAWAKMPSDLETLLEESLQLKWKETDFTPELPKINNILKKKMNKHMKIEEKKADWDEVSFSEEDSSIGSYEEVEVHYDHFDLDGLSEDNLSNEDENWSDIDDIAEDKEFKTHDPTFFEELENLFGEKYRGDNEDDREFIDVLSDTSSIFGDIPEHEYNEIKKTIDKMFEDMPEYVEVLLDHSAGGMFSENHFTCDEDDIEVSGDIWDILGDNTDDEIEIHSDQSSLYDTDSSEEEKQGQENIEKRKKKVRAATHVDEGEKDGDPTGLRKIQVLPPLELTDMEIRDLIKLRFLNQKGKPLSTISNSITPLENEIDCLINIAAEIRGYSKAKEQQDVEDDELESTPMENYPKLDGPTYAWANVSRQGSATDFRALTIDDRINIVPSHYSLELNVPKLCNLHPMVVNDEIHRFREPKSLKEYKLSQTSLEKLRTIKRRKTKKTLKSRIFFLQSQKVRFFHKTSIGKALRKNTRYYNAEVHFPKNCRRCQVPLQETLIPITTPVSALFCCLFPILSAPCFYAHKEFKCYICKEIYVLGDFKPPAEPTPEDREEKRRLDELREEKRILRRKFSNPKYS